ncbi:hypothetical protein [Sphingobacterium cellulitidis]|uniref:Uncharacterized protein n=1 Tax=Sphingobacterium cellulitidis TaxID=1768011 RepID=A0A8H9KVG3_9SPHI|nr:hypothetical protein [Sphingobacterium soli]MBA8986132.1 hypothetical protein [Sphingobacterium soli]GGE17896.1 hypothetical protein GCM10011516_14440 [Sphingobacterium soli]
MEWGDGAQGKPSCLWKAIPSGDGNNDFGFNNTKFFLDHKKMYRYIIWMKKQTPRMEVVILVVEM